MKDWLKGKQVLTLMILVGAVLLLGMSLLSWLVSNPIPLIAGISGVGACLAAGFATLKTSQR